MLRNLHGNYAVEHGKLVRTQTLLWTAGTALFILLDLADDGTFQMCAEFCPTLTADSYETYVKSRSSSHRENVSPYTGIKPELRK